MVLDADAPYRVYFYTRSGAPQIRVVKQVGKDLRLDQGLMAEQLSRKDYSRQTLKTMLDYAVEKAVVFYAEAEEAEILSILPSVVPSLDATPEDEIAELIRICLDGIPLPKREEYMLVQVLLHEFQEAIG
jgi:hypothetical protein